MKIIDKISTFGKKTPFFSFEFFPPKTDEGLQNLYGRLDRMAQLEPLFIDVTWGAGGSTSDQTIDIARNAQKYYGLDVMMHLTCTNMPMTKIDKALSACYEGGVRNILALRGDPPHGQAVWVKSKTGFAYASDLTQHIRTQYGDYFGIGVGGYPEGHLESVSLDEDTRYLKKKVDAGADFIITQLFYDIEQYFEFVKRCRNAGITCPIIPGILPVTNYERFRKFTQICGVKVPPKVLEDLARCSHDDAAVKNYGIELGTKMCESLRSNGVEGFHFYTLNLESAVFEILRNLGLDSKASQRTLPWRPSTMPGRRTEDVRPIFWSNRPKSYMARTYGWDDYPNGRWGDSRSPTFGDLNEYYIIRQGLGLKAQKEDVREIYGEPRSESDVQEIFARFCEGKIRQLPWSEGELHGETGRIAHNLASLNRAGFLTINSQPQVNGASSEDKDVGWGKKNGIVYQKAYIEFFVSPEQLEELLVELKQRETISYQAVNAKGTTFSNILPGEVNAVTWGVFPSSEIIQPTVVDPVSFMIWKDEAFDLWVTDWAERYPEDSPARAVLHGIHDSYYLVNIVENNFVSGDIFAVFDAWVARVNVSGAGKPTKKPTSSVASL